MASTLGSTPPLGRKIRTCLGSYIDTGRLQLVQQQSDQQPQRNRGLQQRKVLPRLLKSAMRGLSHLKTSVLKIEASGAGDLQHLIRKIIQIVMASGDDSG